MAGGWLLTSAPASAQDPAEYERPPRAPKALRCVPVNEPLNFPAYWAGPSFEGVDLFYVDRWCHRPPPARLIGSNRVDFSYGDTSEVIPIEVGNYPSAAMPRDRYTAEDLAALHAEETVIDGVPAKWFGRTKLEVYYPEVTVELGGYGRAQIERLFQALEPAPLVLLEVARYGYVFDSGCVADRGGCLADRPRKESFIGGWVVAVLLALIGPVLAIVSRPPPATGGAAR